MTRYALLLLPTLVAAPRFLGGGAVKMYVLEMGFLLALFGVTWWLRR